jgi:hypothetical protein
LSIEVGLQDVHQVAHFLAGLKNTIVTVFAEQPTFEAPSEGIPELPGIKKIFEMRYVRDANDEDEILCSKKSGEGVETRKFHFRQPRSKESSVPSSPGRFPAEIGTDQVELRKPQKRPQTNKKKCKKYFFAFLHF